MTNSMYRMLAIPARDGVGPGTEVTLSSETLDNDVFAALLGAGTVVGARDQKAGSVGTRITASIETMDEDAAMLLSD